jgi:hypothetical protein
MSAATKPAYSAGRIRMRPTDLMLLFAMHDSLAREHPQIHGVRDPLVSGTG